MSCLSELIIAPGDSNVTSAAKAGPVKAESRAGTEIRRTKASGSSSLTLYRRANVTQR